MNLFYFRGNSALLCHIQFYPLATQAYHSTTLLFLNLVNGDNISLTLHHKQRIIHRKAIHRNHRIDTHRRTLVEKAVVKIKVVVLTRKFGRKYKLIL